jgi:RNA polymerase sigma-70 factor (ECF subfamily)
LCEEAIRLALLMAENLHGDIPETYALLALMHFHFARIAGRQDDSGALLLLEQQDRRQWDKHAITVALNFLERSAQGEKLSRYHVEAGIAAEHCLAPTFAQTHWDKIVAAYELLERIAPSAFHVLNRAIALAEWKGPKAGLAVLQTAELPSWLTRSYHWSAVLADLQGRDGDMASARKNAERAIKEAPTDDIKQLLRKRFKACDV